MNGKSILNNNAGRKTDVSIPVVLRFQGIFSHRPFSVLLHCESLRFEY